MNLDNFIELICDAFEYDEGFRVTPEMKLTEMEGWDSVVVMTIRAMVEEEFNIIVDNQEITESLDIGTFYKLVIGKKQ